ncbi:tripartite tricarboxylate transporter substrate-binding protein [Polaromonas sp.]|uniref:tripartite tricarboxylate transporter substrate-binding protein n=1 Tax=Polaromonas sp. TaxID=1869339 RepID=UPI003BAD00B7
MEFNMQSQSDVSLTHAPYKGTSSSITDLVSVSIHLALDTISTAFPFVKDGRLGALASGRSSSRQELRTFLLTRVCRLYRRSGQSPGAG